jgi:hypothetical protein
MAFPTTYTTAITNVTPIQAIHLNNLEAKVGIAGDNPGINPLGLSSLDYMLNNKLDTAIFTVDHSIAGHHVLGTWQINAVAVTASGTEINRALTASGATVTAANLTSLTNGSNVGAMHIHTSLNGMIVIKERQDSGVAGGTFTKDIWQTRVLNLLEYDDVGIVLAAGQFTLPAGSYVINAGANAYDCDEHQAALYNVTDVAWELIGTTCRSRTSYGDQYSSVISGAFTIAAPKTFAIKHQCRTTKTVQGLGYPAGFLTDPQDEVYVIVTLNKYA